MKAVQVLLLLLGLTSVLFAQYEPEPKHSLHGQPLAWPDDSNREKFDVRYYRNEIKIDLAKHQVRARTTVRLNSLQNDLKTVTLDFDSPMSIDSVGGAASSFTRENGRLTLKLKQTFQKGQDLTIWLAYAGNPQEQGSIAFVFDRMPDGSPYLWTLSEPFGARQWWPCKDTPADKADSVDMFITVPAGNLAASNGLLVSVLQDSTGWQTFHWHEGYPIATYLLSIVAGPYFHFTDYYHYTPSDSLLLDYYVFPEEQNVAPTIFSEMPDYLAALSHYLGPYPFLQEKYGQAQFGWRGGMEHQTLTSVGRVTSGWRFLYVHELGHQWFGDQVTCASWHDIWLNEGFASYCEALYAEWAGFGDFPPGPQAYHAYMNTQLFWDDGTIFIQDTTDFGKIFGRIVYDKGSWVLHMLRKVIGEAQLFEAFKQYLNDQRWTYGSVRTENFKEICERVSGQNLDAFFDQWLNYPFYPMYEYEWQTFTNPLKEHVLNLTIRQTQQQTLYVMPIELLVLFIDETDTLITVQNDRFTQDYSFTFDREPIHLVFDPDNWLLDESKEVSTNPLIESVGFRRIFPNPAASSVNIELVYWQKEAQPIAVYNLLGQKVRTLLPYHQIFNLHQYFWDLKNEQGQPVATGLYFLRAPGIVGSKVRKILIVK